MSEYRTRYAKVQFKNLSVTHPEYKVYPKLFSVPNEFYEYVAYVNPGPKTKLMFSVSMNRQKIEASVSEMEAYQKVIASLQMLGKMTANNGKAAVH
jgi:hypothetical protein